MTRNKILVLFLIVFLGFFLRFWKLDSVPPSLYWDEVSQGYNAYSILKTGRDEHNEFLPLTRFQAFGDYKAPVYIYLDVPFIALFGKTALAVRLPSALFGSLTVILTFLLTYELFIKSKQRFAYAFVSSFLLAISPWHIQLSRVAYEGNVATFFTVLGAYLFFLAKRKNTLFYIFSLISLIVAFYSFNAHRVFIPLFILLLTIVYYKDLFVKKRIIIFTCIIGFVLIFPFLLYLRSPESKLRFNEVNIFSDVSVIKESNRLIEQGGNTKFANIIDNRRVLFGLLYVKHYFDFFNPSYLFFSGDINPRFSSRDTGELFLWELPFILIGLYLLIAKRSRSSVVIIGWFLLAAVGAATARETPHALRSETFIPTYEIIASIGIVYSWVLLKKLLRVFIPVGLIACGIVVVFSVYSFMHNYMTHFPIIFSHEWQYGYEQVIKETEKEKNNYDEIVFSQTYGRPYIYMLFYSDIKPEEFWKDGIMTKDVFGFYDVPKIGKYIFVKNFPTMIDGSKKVLYVGKADEIPPSAIIVKEISFLNGDPAFVLAKNK